VITSGSPNLDSRVWRPPFLLLVLVLLLVLIVRLLVLIVRLLVVIGGL